MNSLVKSGVPLFRDVNLNEFIKNNIDIAMSLKDGEYQKNIFSDELFVIPQNSLLKSPQESIYESHKQYYDIHYCIKGMEKLELLSIDDIGDFYEMNAENDYYLYKTNKVPTETVLSQNQFTIFPFSDVHKVGIKTDNNLNSVVKIVIKIKKELFDKEFINE